MEKTFELKYENNEINFNLRYSFSHIRLKKIVISFTGETNNWFELIYKVSPILHIEYSDRNNSTTSYPKVLSALISPYHYQPVFEIDEIIPYENSRNMTSLGNYVTTLKIKFKYEETEEVYKRIKILMVYQDTPGVEEIKK